MSSHQFEVHDTAEERRIIAADSGQQDWRAWGPYLSERAWGTVTAENRGPDEATIHLLPTLWFRNTWAWGLPGADAVPQIRAEPDVSTGTRLLSHQTGWTALVADLVMRTADRGAPRNRL